MVHFFILFFLPFVSFAQEVAAPAATAPAPFPWQDNVIVMGGYLVVLSVLRLVVDKIPGKLGELVKWLIDILSANVRHK